MIIIFILIYLVSLVIHIIMCYKENRWHISYVGDLLDKIDFYMWFPILNTLMLIVVVVGIFIIKLGELLKLDILWDKFRNIKLR